MSCFILSDQTTAELAELLERAANRSQWNGNVVCGIFNGKELYKMLTAEYQRIFQRECVELDVKKVYAVLRTVNNIAYHHRYDRKSQNVDDALPQTWRKEQYMRNKWQMLKTFDCYIYQITEEPIYKTPVFETLQTACNYFRRHCIGQIPEYKNAVWG